MGFVFFLILLAVVSLVIAMIVRGVWEIVRRVGAFVIGEVGDMLRVAGAGLVAMILVFPTVFSVLLGRWSAAAHFGRAIQAEGRTMLAALYRVMIGHPARLFLLENLVEGIETRIPRAFAQAPGADVPRWMQSGGRGSRGTRREQFEGYTIIGSLPGGGSGARLYIAEASPEKSASLARTGHHGVNRVVIKTFTISDDGYGNGGASLPQIVRENRSIPAARRLGLILEHELNNDRFFYVMRYVPGESLGLITQRLHAESGADGLNAKYLRAGLGYVDDLLGTLREYHAGGLWHKDVKPDNIIIGATDRRAHLVDFGLVTALGSTMTLTTHGTEYFRDPELVRMAIKGVKVHEVDGARFDVYAAGAVLYSIVENSFPAHGGLSQISKKCPEVVRWIVRRAMADYDKRYTSAAAMLADLRAVTASADAFAMKPIDLPSMKGGAAEAPREAVGVGAAGADAVRVAAGSPRSADVQSSPLPAREQILHARSRAEQARKRAHERIAARRDRTSGRLGPANRHGPGVNIGVAVAVLLFVGLVAVWLASMFMQRAGSSPSAAWTAIDAHDDHNVDAPVAPLPEGEAATLAVLRDPIAYEPWHTDEVDEVLHEFEAAGFEVFGEDGDSTAADAEANLRSRIGVMPHASTDARSAILSWLDENPEYVGVVWIGRDEKGIEPAYWFVDRPGTASVVTDTAMRLLVDAAIERALK